MRASIWPAAGGSISYVHHQRVTNGCCFLTDRAQGRERSSSGSRNLPNKLFVAHQVRTQQQDRSVSDLAAPRNHLLRLRIDIGAPALLVSEPIAASTKV